jgi:hypothetical protein
MPSAPATGDATSRSHPYRQQQSGPCKSSILAVRYHARNMARSPLFPVKNDVPTHLGVQRWRRSQEILHGFYLYLNCSIYVTELYIPPRRGTHAFIATTRLLLARKRLLAGRLEVCCLSPILPRQCGSLNSADPAIAPWSRACWRGPDFRGTGRFSRDHVWARQFICCRKPSATRYALRPSD